jgi:hypothetical protein
MGKKLLLMAVIGFVAYYGHEAALLHDYYKTDIVRLASNSYFLGCAEATKQFKACHNAAEQYKLDLQNKLP